MLDTDRDPTSEQLKHAFGEARKAYAASAYPGSLIEDLGLDEPSLLERLKRWRWPGAVAAMLALAVGVWWGVARSVGEIEPTRAASVVDPPVPDRDISSSEPTNETTLAVAKAGGDPSVISGDRIESIALLARTALGELLVGHSLPPMPNTLSFSTRALTAAMPAMPRPAMPSPGEVPCRPSSTVPAPPSS